MRSITVSVEYDDLLAITLSRNARHFEELWVVSAPHDAGTAAVVASVPNARLFVTDAFYRRGANFNKGLAMEEGLDAMGREGWIVIWDADIVMPPALPLPPLDPACLYGPRRRMLENPKDYHDALDWQTLPLKPDGELAGYFQLFHASAPVLQARPWYGTDWRHAGGCDSDFMRKWPAAQQRRPDFEVLHLGLDGQNWMGRATLRIDGRPVRQVPQRLAAMQALRQTRRTRGLPRYHGEKLG